MNHEISIKWLGDYDSKFIMDSTLYMIMEVPDDEKIKILNDKNYTMQRKSGTRSITISYPFYLLIWHEAKKFNTRISRFIRAAVKLYSELNEKKSEPKEKVIDTVYGRIHTFYDGKKVLFVHFVDYKNTIEISNETRTTEIQFNDINEYEKLKQNFEIKMVCELLERSLSRSGLNPKYISSLAIILNEWCR